MRNRTRGLETEFGIHVTKNGARVTLDAVARNLISACSNGPMMGSYWLANGARYYLDVGSHAEYATPETTTSRDTLAYLVAGDRIASRCLEVAAGRNFGMTNPGDVTVRLLRNNLDAVGNSYGAHESYLVAALDWDALSDTLLGHLSTRNLFCGAGNVGPDSYRMSQRAAFTVCERSTETTRNRALISQRNESLGDASRLHLICGDATMLDTASLLRVSTTDAVLRIGEEGESVRETRPLDPIETLHTLDADPFAAAHIKFETVDGATWTALSMQRYLAEAARTVYDRHGADADEEYCWDLWVSTLDAFDRGDWATLARRVDWVAKHAYLNALLERHGGHIGDVKTGAADLLWHDIDPATSITAKMRGAGLLDVHVDEAQVVAACHTPPDNRAKLRVALLEAAEQHGWSAGARWEVASVRVGRYLRHLHLKDPTANDMAVVNAFVAELIEDPSLNSGFDAQATANIGFRLALADNA